VDQQQQQLKQRQQQQMAALQNGPAAHHQRIHTTGSSETNGDDSELKSEGGEQQQLPSALVSFSDAVLTYAFPNPYSLHRSTAYFSNSRAMDNLGKWGGCSRTMAMAAGNWTSPWSIPSWPITQVSAVEKKGEVYFRGEWHASDGVQ